MRHREGALQWREEGKRGMGDSCSGLGVCGVGSFAAKEKKKKGERERERENGCSGFCSGTVGREGMRCNGQGDSRWELALLSQCVRGLKVF